jgi:hypothetical protein
MKAKIIREFVKFTPVVLQITIESRDELFELWHRLNMSEEDLEECEANVSHVPMPNMPSYCHYDFFQTVDDIVKQLI